MLDTVEMHLTVEMFIYVKVQLMLIWFYMSLSNSSHCKICGVCPFIIYYKSNVLQKNIFFLSIFVLFSSINIYKFLNQDACHESGLWPSPDSHQRSPFHRIDSCTTLLLHVTNGLQFPSSIALTTHTQLIALITPENYHTPYINDGLPFHRSLSIVRLALA